LEKGGKPATAVEVDGPFQASTTSAQLVGAMAGMGIVLLPLGLTASHVAAGRLVRVLPDFSSGATGVHLVYHSRRQLPRAVSAFVEFAASTIAELGLFSSEHALAAKRTQGASHNRS
jgi:LysR family transcriptional regulator AphB